MGTPCPPPLKKTNLTQTYKLTAVFFLIYDTILFVKLKYTCMEVYMYGLLVQNIALDKPPGASCTSETFMGRAWEMDPGST